MKLTVEQHTLTALLSRVSNAVEKRNTIPILSNVLLKASGNTLTATATDMDVEVTTTCEATVIEQGGTTVSVAMLSAIIAKLQKGKLVELQSDGLSMRIKSGRSDLTLAALPIDDFPQIATSEYETEFLTDQTDIKRLLDLSSFAMSTEETRYYLNGVYLHCNDGVMRAVATDGHRLARIDSVVNADFQGIIVPRKTVNLMKGLLDDGPVTVSISPTKIKVDIGHTVVVSKTIDGTFPDYNQIVPDKHTTEVTVSAADVKQAAALVALVSAEKTRAVKITVSGDTMHLTVRSGAELGVEDVDAVLDGDDVETGVNSKYLAEVLQACNGDNAIMRFRGAGDPIVIQPSEDSMALFLVMPMRI